MDSGDVDWVKLWDSFWVTNLDQYSVDPDTFNPAFRLGKSYIRARQLLFTATRPTLPCGV